MGRRNDAEPDTAGTEGPPCRLRFSGTRRTDEGRDDAVGVHAIRLTAAVSVCVQRELKA